MGQRTSYIGVLAPLASLLFTQAVVAQNAPTIAELLGEIAYLDREIELGHGHVVVGTEWIPLERRVVALLEQMRLVLPVEPKSRVDAASTLRRVAETCARAKQVELGAELLLLSEVLVPGQLDTLCAIRLRDNPALVASAICARASAYRQVKLFNEFEQQLTELLEPEESGVDKEFKVKLGRMLWSLRNARNVEAEIAGAADDHSRFLSTFPRVLAGINCGGTFSPTPWSAREPAATIARGYLMDLSRREPRLVAEYLFAATPAQIFRGSATPIEEPASAEVQARSAKLSVISHLDPKCQAEYARL